VVVTKTGQREGRRKTKSQHKSGKGKGYIDGEDITKGGKGTKSQKSGKGSTDGEGITKGGKTRTKSPKSEKEKSSTGPPDITTESTTIAMIPSGFTSESPSVSVNPSSAPSNVPSVSVNPSSAPSNVPSVSMNPSVAVSIIECALQLYL